MNRYVSHRSAKGLYIINLEETWQKIKLAARVIAAIPNPADVMVYSYNLNLQRLSQQELWDKDPSLSLPTIPKPVQLNLQDGHQVY